MADRDDIERSKIELDDLDAALRALGQHLDVPPAPPGGAVATAVRARIASAAVRAPRRKPMLRYALVILLLLAAGVVIAVPPVRAAVLEFFRIGAVEVHEGTGPGLPATPTLPQQQVADLDEAQRLTGQRVEAPAELGPPDEILVIERRVVSLVYEPTAGRPAVRLDVVAGRLDPAFEKYLRFNEPRLVDVGETTAWFLPGPHEIIYRDEQGQQRRESARLSAATLIWKRGTTTYRLEAPLASHQLAEIARSIPR